MPSVRAQISSPKKFSRRFARRLGALLKKQRRLVQSCHQQGDAGQIHELRTCSRRLRVMLALAAPHLGKKRTRHAIRHTRKISRITSRLRDLDVALDLFARRPKPSRMIPALRRRRHALWRRHREELLASSPSFPGPGRVERLEKCGAKLLRRYARKQERLRSRLLVPIADFDARPLSQQHDFRRTVRRLRYLRELGLPHHRLAHDPVCQILIRTQNAIGKRLDEAVYRAVVSGQKPNPAAPRTGGRLSPILAKLQSILAGWEICPPGSLSV